MENVLNQNISYQKYFEEMTRIPHGSFCEQRYSDYLVTWAKEHHYKYIQDDMGNVIVYKPASAGYESHEPVLLQAHMDMVCVCAPGVDHDFDKDPLELYIEDGWLKAWGTTLGADDGVGCAYMLAILEDESLAHPPLECVFTVQEEVGCNGAANLKAEYFKAKRMLGLDDVGGGTSYVTSAGSQIVRLSRKVSWEKNKRPAYRMHIDGLLSGHSGADIEKERGNAIKIAAKILYAMQKQGEVRLADVKIGDANNVIPANGDVVFTAQLSDAKVRDTIERYHGIFLQQLHWSDPGLRLELYNCTAEKVMSAQDSADLIGFTRFVPNGFFHQSTHFKGLTTVSSNLGVWKMEDDVSVLECCSRSSMESYLDMNEEEQLQMCEVYHIEREQTARVAGFDYIENSPIRSAVDNALFEVTGRHIQEIFVHGGIEAGYFTRLVPGMDVVTIGPLAPDEHTVNERLNLQSFDEIYQTIVKALATL